MSSTAQKTELKCVNSIPCSQDIQVVPNFSILDEQDFPPLRGNLHHGTLQGIQLDRAPERNLHPHRLLKKHLSSSFSITSFLQAVLWPSHRSHLDSHSVLLNRVKRSFQLLKNQDEDTKNKLFSWCLYSGINWKNPSDCTGPPRVEGSCSPCGKILYPTSTVWTT